MKKQRVYIAYKPKVRNSNIDLPSPHPKRFPQDLCTFVNGKQTNKKILLSISRKKYPDEEEWGKKCSCLSIYNPSISSKTHCQSLFACLKKNMWRLLKNQYQEAPLRSPLQMTKICSDSASSVLVGSHLSKPNVLHFQQKGHFSKSKLKVIVLKI